MDDLLVPAVCPVDVVYNESREDIEVKNHFHNSYEIIYVLEGKIQLLINDRNYIVKENSLIFINNMESHKLKVLEHPYKRFFILIKPEYFKSVVDEPSLSSIFKDRSEDFKHVIELEPEKFECIYSIIQNFYKEINDKNEFWELAVKSSLYSLLIILYRSYRTYFPLSSMSDSMHVIVEIQKYIEEHYLEQISLEDISRLFYRDMYYISHLFRKVTGFNFKEYLILQRISKAKDLLFHTDDNITQVCINSGFSNVNHFIRIFKKYQSITPYQYRKKYR